MKERPILFSGMMVRAILEGRKSMTRRVVKPQPPEFVNDARGSYAVLGYRDWGSLGGWLWSKGAEWGSQPWFDGPVCPYGVPGDRLWVRETFTTTPICDFKASMIGYRATAGEAWTGATWKPSIFMPRNFSRITLEVTGVRVERLQEISESDAIAEGVDFEARCDAWRDYVDENNVLPSAVQSFASLWSKINGLESWDANPWVWVVEFKRV